jgi:hypothetical protein
MLKKEWKMKKLKRKRQERRKIEGEERLNVFLTKDYHFSVRLRSVHDSNARWLFHYAGR